MISGFIMPKSFGQSINKTEEINTRRKIFKSCAEIPIDAVKNIYAFTLSLDALDTPSGLK